MTSERTPGRPLKRLVLPFWMSVFTLTTITPNSSSTARLISGLVDSIDTRNTTWFRSVRLVAFSVITGARMMLNIVSRDMVAAFLRAT